jgi:dimethylglycine dehydrogenase
LLPQRGVTLRNLSDTWSGFALSGPLARKILQPIIDRDLSNTAFPFMSCAETGVGLGSGVVARLSLTGELGYELYVPAAQQRMLYHALMDAGHALGLRNIGNRALDSLRLEKSFGIWSTEFTQSMTPGMCGLDRHIAFDKGDFIGRDTALREREAPAPRKLVTLAVDATDADASGFEPVKLDGRLVGYTTSGAYGHSVSQSLALAYIDRNALSSIQGMDGLDCGLTVDVVGESRNAFVLGTPAYDALGMRMRG